MKAKAVFVARFLLGLIFFVFGLNFFFRFIPLPPSPDAAAKFLGALFETGYMFQVIKTIEISCGFLLLTNLFVPLALILLAPITLNIFLFHFILDPAGLALATVMLVLHVFLGLAYIKRYSGFLTARS